MTRRADDGDETEPRRRRNFDRTLCATTSPYGVERDRPADGIDYIISPDAKSALVLNWGEKKTYLYDFATLQPREVELSPDDVSAFQRRAP